MCYMMSKDAHLSDRDGHWHPHLMFLVTLIAAKAWGAGLRSAEPYSWFQSRGGRTVPRIPKTGTDKLPDGLPQLPVSRPYGRSTSTDRA